MTAPDDLVRRSAVLAALTEERCASAICRECGAVSRREVKIRALPADPRSAFAEEVARAAETALATLRGAHAGLSVGKNSAHKECRAWCPLVQSADALDAALAKWRLS